MGAFSVIDCDGHLVESITDLAAYMAPPLRQAVLAPGRNREGAFPSLDGFHGPRSAAIEGSAGPRPADRRAYVQASDARKGSCDDYLAFLEKAAVEQAVLFTSEGLAVGFIRTGEAAVQICRAYNDYVYEEYGRRSERLHPMALIPFQDPAAAVAELRRAVVELGIPGAMVPSTGLPLHVGHEYYWPIYAAASELQCVLGLHGGSTAGTGMDTFSLASARASLHHSIPLMVGMASLAGHGVLDRYPDFRVGFFEGGCGWLACLLDRMERGYEVFGRTGLSALADHLANGRILIGCEGNDPSLAYLVEAVGAAPFAWASDYPHEVDLETAKQMIAETVARPSLAEADKAAILSENARRFFNLARLGPMAVEADAAGAAAR